MREYRSYGSVRGALSNERSYRESLQTNVDRREQRWTRVQLKTRQQKKTQGESQSPVIQAGGWLDTGKRMSP